MNVINNTKIRQLDFTLLLILNGLIRHRKTVTVATELGLSQSAISHALARLRELFSDPLFIRHSHGLRPTQRALDLAPYVEHLLEEAASAIGSTETFNPMTSTREFRIGMSEYLASIIAGPLFRKFSLMAPDASFTIKSSIGAESLDELDGYQLDLLVGNFNSLPPHLSSRQA